MYQLATAPRGIGQVLDSVFRLTRAAWLRLMPYAIISTLLSAVPLLYMLTTGVLDDPARVATMALSKEYWISVLVIVPVSLCLYGAGVLRIESIAQGEDMGFGASIRGALPKIWALFLGSICFMLVIGVGFALLVVPGIILLGSTFLFLPAIMLDGKGPVDSLSYSHKLVWGNWWRVATIGTIAFIIIYVIFMLAALMVGIFAGLGGGDPATLFMVNLGSTVIGGLLLTAFYFALYVEIYREVKMRKEGGDLAARIAAVGTAR